MLQNSGNLIRKFGKYCKYFGKLENSWGNNWKIGKFKENLVENSGKWCLILIKTCKKLAKIEKNFNKSVKN